MMTLDEAIQHCQEKSCNNDECSREHHQLGEWLLELKHYREKSIVQHADDDLQKEIKRMWEVCHPVDEGMGYESANIMCEQFEDIAKHFVNWTKEKMMVNGSTSSANAATKSN